MKTTKLTGTQITEAIQADEVLRNPRLGAKMPRRTSLHITRNIKRLAIERESFMEQQKSILDAASKPDGKDLTPDEVKAINELWGEEVEVQYRPIRLDELGKDDSDDFYAFMAAIEWMIEDEEEADDGKDKPEKESKK